MVKPNGAFNTPAKINDSPVHAGLFYEGGEVYEGAIFKPGPGSVGQGFITFAAPDNPIYLNGSVIVQALFAFSPDGKIDLTGKGKTYGAGVGPVSGSYSYDAATGRTKVIGVGPSMGLKASAGATSTRTITFPIINGFTGLLSVFKFGK